MTAKKPAKKEAPVLNEKELDDAIKSKALELRSDKFNAEQFDNFMAALNAKCLLNEKARIESYMKHRDYARLGLLVMNAIVAKLDEWAYDEAAGLYNSTLGGGDNEI